MATRIVHGIQGGFAPLLKRFLQMGAVLAPILAHGVSEAAILRFGRLPGFTNCKPKYRKPDGLFPFVRLHSYGGQQYPMADGFEQEITKQYEAREQEREARRLESSLSPQSGRRLSNISLSASELRSSTRTGPPLLI